jgi:hypothetical protein
LGTIKRAADCFVEVGQTVGIHPETTRHEPGDGKDRSPRDKDRNSASRSWTPIRDRQTADYWRKELGDLRNEDKAVRERRQDIPQMFIETYLRTYSCEDYDGWNKQNELVSGQNCRLLAIVARRPIR